MTFRLLSALALAITLSSGNFNGVIAGDCLNPQYSQGQSCQCPSCYNCGKAPRRSWYRGAPDARVMQVVPVNLTDRSALSFNQNMAGLNFSAKQEKQAPPVAALEAEQKFDQRIAVLEEAVLQIQEMLKAQSNCTPPKPCK